MAHPEYNFTGLLGAAVVSVLDAGQTVVTTSAILQNRDDAEVVLPRLDVDVINCARASAQMMRRSDAWDYPARYAYNHYRADLVIGIATDRIAATEDHGALVGTVRYLLSQEAQSFVSPVVTLFEVLSIEETGTSHAIDNDTREDLTQVAYSIDFALTQDAVSPTLTAIPAISALTISYSGNAIVYEWDPPANPSTLQIEFHKRSLAGEWSGTPYATVASNYLSGFYSSGHSAGDYAARARLKLIADSSKGPYSGSVTGTIVTP